MEVEESGEKQVRPRRITWNWQAYQSAWCSCSSTACFEEAGGARWRVL